MIRLRLLLQRVNASGVYVINKESRDCDNNKDSRVCCETETDLPPGFCCLGSRLSCRRVFPDAEKGTLGTSMDKWWCN